MNDSTDKNLSSSEATKIRQTFLFPTLFLFRIILDFEKNQQRNRFLFKKLPNKIPHGFRISILKLLCLL